MVIKAGPPRTNPQENLRNNTIDGLLAYCDWLVETGYGTAAQVEPWKTAVKKVFHSVEGEDYDPHGEIHGPVHWHVRGLLPARA